MTESSGKENRHRIIISAIMLVVIFAITVVFFVQIVARTEKRAFFGLKDAAEDADFRMNLLVDETYNALKSMSAVIVSHDRREEAGKVAESLSSHRVGKLAMNVRIYYPNGGALTELGYINDVKQYVDYNDILGKITNDRYISCAKEDYLYPGKEVFEMFTPVKVGDEIIVIISAVINTNSPSDFLDINSFDGHSNAIFVDTRDGMAFLDTFHGKSSNFKQFKDRKDKDGISIEPFVNKVLMCEEADTTLISTSTGKTMYLYAIPSQVEGWVAIIMVDEAVVFAESNTIGKALLVLVILEALIFLAYLIWMINSARKQVIDESNKLVSQMTGYDGLFLIDFASDKRKTIYNHCVTVEEYTDEEKYSQTFTKYINNYVAESDREELLRYASVKNLKEIFKNEKEINLQYRDISMGIQRFTEMRFVKISNNEVLQSFKEEDKEIIDQFLFNRMKDDYFALVSVDLDSGILRVIRKSPWYPMAEEGSVCSYSETIKVFAGAFEGETKAFFEELSNPDYFGKRLEKEDKFTYIYKSNIVKGTKWVSVTCLAVTRNTDNTPSICAIGFSLLDENASQIQDYQEQLNNDMQMIGGLASEYHTLYFYNINEGIFNVYSMDGQRFPELKQYVNNDSSPISMLREYGNSELVHPDDREQFNVLSEEFVKEKLAHSKKYTLRFRRKYYGEYLWLEMDIIKYEDIDVTPNAIAIGFAIRDKEIREEQRRKEELETAKNAADVANASKTNFLFSMSHDIRTPLNAITGFTTMAQKSIDNKDKVKEYLEKIDISGQQLVALINQVLEMARIESGKIELIEKPVNIYDKFNGLVTILAEQTRANGQEFRYSLNDIVHDTVMADEARMGSIALNIVGNAMKYTPKGGSIDFALKEIEPRKEGYATYVFTVADTGIGMSKEYQEKLFEPFSREKTSTVSKIQGTGLGMSIVKNIVDLVGGDIKVSSELNKGSRFEVTIDFKLAKDNAEQEITSAMRSQVTFEGRRALVVEDNEMNREIVKYILQDKGITVEEAEDGDIALQMLKEIADRKDYFYYDFVLMDVQMPKMNGFEATKAIREIPTPEGVRLPIIAMTANAFEEDRQNAFASGMDEHVAKPIDVNVLFDTIAKFLK